MYQDVLVLGGAGLVGTQVCRQIAAQLSPRKVLVASLLPAEALAACEQLQAKWGPHIAFVPVSGNLFVPSSLAHMPRADILNDPTLRRELLAQLYGSFDDAYANNHLVQLIRRHRPQVIVDCVNTATGLSYQNVFDGAAKVMNWLAPNGFDSAGLADLEGFLLSQSVPQMIRHIRFLHRATIENATAVYVKVGTTGTGGMGLNIPYTHSEDKPSKVLLAKTEAGFGHTGLLFLLARTPGAPAVKEVKPAAMIGYRAVKLLKVKDKYRNKTVFEPHQVPIRGRCDLREADAEYRCAGELEVAVVDTGENGIFTRGEFAAITALGQMEYITPEEIASVVVREITGANTGQDVISAVDSAVLNPSYKAGLLRAVALTDLAKADESAPMPSVALGRLGPPELSKLLFEAQLIKEVFGGFHQVLYDGNQPRAAGNLSKALTAHLATSSVRQVAPSVGIPILLPDGQTLLRGPRINVPEVSGHDTTVSIDDSSQVDRWAKKGWVDLRKANMATWLTRFEAMVRARNQLRDTGSAAASIHAYMPVDFEIGEVVAWIFNNEMDGHRIQ